MNRQRDIEDFPPGTRVRTPSGLMGTVVKATGSASKRDHFQRLRVQIGPRARDIVVLQPGLLERVENENPVSGERAVEK